MARTEFPEYLDLRVDFRKTIAQAVADAGFDHVEREIVPERYATMLEAVILGSPYRGAPTGIVAVRLEPVRGPDLGRTAEAFRVIEELGLRPALFEDMLALAAERPDLILGQDYVGLGSVRADRVPKIEACGGGPVRLELGYARPYDTWASPIFLGVRTRTLIHPGA